jgi:hypothetical protein
MTPRHAYHKPFMVRFPDLCKWKNGFKLDMEGGLVWYTEGVRPIEALILGCKDGAQKVSVFGSTPQYSRLKYTILRLV